MGSWLSGMNERDWMITVRGSFGSDRSSPVPRPSDFFHRLRDSSSASEREMRCWLVVNWMQEWVMIDQFPYRGWCTP